MTPENRDARLERILADDLAHRDAGRPSPRDVYVAENPDLADELREAFDDIDRMERLATGRVVPHDEALPLGTEVGPYRLDAVIGRGGMGVIYRATHTTLGTTKAIKVLARELAGRDELVARFEREARALASLDHPNIVRVDDIGEQRGVHYFVMAYVDGLNLRELMARETVTRDQALRLVAKVCAALAYAHEHGVVHRDVKPANILVDRDGEPHVVDFGLARLLGAEPATRGLTRTEVVMGTYDYMAPEQKNSARVDHRADIYAVGVMLYEMLTGRLPVGRFPLPSRAADVDERLDDVVMRALESEPDARYQRAEHLARDVSTVLETGAPPTSRHPARRLRVRDLDEDDDELAVPAPQQGEGAVIHVDGSVRLGKGRGGKTPAGARTVASGDEVEVVWLRIVACEEVDVTVQAWSHVDEIGIDSDDEYALALHTDETPPSAWLGGAGPGCLVLRVEDDTDVFVPADLPVQIVGPSNELEVKRLTAPVRIDAGEGDVTITEHDGPLLVERLDEASVHVSGLTTADAEIHVRAGDVFVSGLSVDHGRVTIDADDGDIVVGALDGACHGRFTLRSTTGTVDCEYGEVARRDARGVEGRLGSGLGGELTASSHAGRVRLIDHQGAVWHEVSERHRAELVGWGSFALVMWLLDMHTLAWVTLAWVACSIALDVWRRVRAADPGGI